MKMQNTSIFHLKRNDTSRSLWYELFPSDTDLVGASVVFSMRSEAGLQIISRAPATIISTSPPVVGYDWEPEDTATAGKFVAEFEVTYAGGAVETFPNWTNIGITIMEDLG